MLDTRKARKKAPRESDKGKTEEKRVEVKV
jgi:hypothetical protein